MKPDVTASQLHSLVRVQRALLRGRPAGADLQNLGALLAFYIDSQGWRAQGVNEVRRMMTELLRRWVIAATEEKIAGNPVTDDVIRALSSLWGLRRRSVDRPTAANEAGIGVETLESWQRSIFSDRQLRRSIADLIPATDGTPTIPAHQRPLEILNDWDEWPVADWPALSAAILRTGEVDQKHLEDAGRALREVVGERVREYARDEAGSNLGRHISRAILEKWRHRDSGYFGAPIEPGPASTGGGTGAETAVLLQMFAFDAVLPPAERLRQSLLRRRSIRSLHRVKDRDLRDIRAITEPRREQAKLELSVARKYATTLETLTNPAEVNEFLRLSVLRPSRATFWAGVIQRAGWDERPMLIEHYIGLRQGVAWHDSAFDDDLELLDGSTPTEARRRQIALADQLVRLQAVHVERSDLVDKIGEVQRDEGGRHDHGDLGHRDMGLVRGKLGDRFGGLAMLAHTRRAIRVRLENNEGGDALELLEDLQQTTLSICGACTTLVEAHLIGTRRQGQVSGALTDQARAALRYSAEAFDMLADLSQRFPDALLPERRLADHRHISWAGWIETALQNRLRALVSVHTARLAGLVSFGDEGGAFDTSLPAIRALYLELVTLGRLSAETVHKLGMQATWLAMLDHGRIPVPNEDVPAPALLELTFLDGPDRALGSAQISVADSADWHRGNGDSGTLGRIREGTLAWKMLRESSKKISVTDRETAPINFELWRQNLA